MRQGQQNRRGRGRNNNNNNNNQNQNRKGQNPLTRSFESNGPDMKIRGTPAHIAEKYIAMARDAHSSGDPVLAENYLQHAEHYNRIILAYREQQISQGGGDMSGLARPRPAQLIDNTDGEDIDEDENGGVAGDPGEMPQPHVAGLEPQPSSQPQQHQPREFRAERFDNRPQRDRHEHQGQRQHHDRNDRNDRNDRRDRFERGPRPDRNFGGDNPRGERHSGEGQRDNREGRDFRGPRDYREPREPREPRGFQAERPAYDNGPERAERPQQERAPQPVEAAAEAPAAEAATRSTEPRRRERFAGSQHEQPEFLRRPVRRPRREPAAGAEEVAGAVPAPAGSDEPGGE